MKMVTNTFGKLKEIDEVISLFHDDMTLMFGGFGGIGSPPSLIQAIVEKGITNLHLIGNDTGFPDVGIGRLITRERVKSLVTSHIGSNPNAGRQLNEGKLQIEFSPQGTLAERIRAGGVGLGGILVDVGVDTVVEEGKRTVELNGKTFLVETALTAEIAIVYAKKADPFGNIVFDKSARNMNPHVAMAGDITIVEAEEIVPLGALHPEEIVVPGAFIDYIVPSEGVNWKWAWE
ncbi:MULTISPECIES: 3-oxoacid CoA-transferase subunit A [Bacillus cereus group]|uniref:Coenzyme A transferase subunit alpha n=1 Tax=Bacillus cytotoxicus TaxID=580165 RepID=A0AAX2CGT9_9BACI|nr:MULTISPECIES: CoA transferase subunit A [Bacillus cereus group]AWC28595.1 CoA transferase subunit A [Bacillus cytotoxicus]AWC40022.1 CoA transferase subunit A [Bacillus cytotoxicus]AWC47953.1 CoA transferase subunit A [Bacillus cytotoxicus]AWC52663.1 CoA transferase subunit A [Bacillus cytotoxicus]AWC56795.1 CoA transferase subunit A [Bacillus cytotoxicus]